MFFRNGMAMEIFGRILAVKVGMDKEEEGEGLRKNTNGKGKEIINNSRKQLTPSKPLSTLQVRKIHFTHDPE